MSKERTYQYTMKDGELIKVEDITDKDSTVSSLPLDAFINPTKDDESEGQ